MEDSTNDTTDGSEVVDEEFDVDRAKAKIAKANAEARNLRERLKAAEEKAKRFDEIEDAERSEVERLTKQLAEMQEKAQEADLRAMRAEVAQEKGLTAAQAKRLVGGSLEELAADADELLETFMPQEGTGGTPPSGKPVEALRSGGDPTEEPIELDPARLAESVPRRF